MRRTALIAALFAGAMATPAFAQDGEPTGLGDFHIAAIAGYDAPDGDVDDTSGIVYGISAGYDFNLGRNLFIGPEVEVTSSTTSECANGINRAGDELCLEAGRDLYAGGRIGFRLGARGQHKVYAGGGYSNAEVGLRYDANLAGTTGDFDVTDELDGFRLKAGGELGLGRNAFVRAEYRYSSYDDGDFDRHQFVGGIGLRF